MKKKDAVINNQEDYKADDDAGQLNDIPQEVPNSLPNLNLGVTKRRELCSTAYGSPTRSRKAEIRPETRFFKADKEACRPITAFIAETKCMGQLV